MLSVCFSFTLIKAQSKQLKLDSLINKSGADFIKDNDAVGLSIGIYNNGHISFYNFGSTNVQKVLLPTENTIYEIGSITKTFVSLILANAVLEHKVKLDDDIRQYLNETYPNLEYKGSPIRLVHLANTTSGLPDWLPELGGDIKNMPPDSALSIKINYYKDLSSKDFFTALHTVQIDTLPGSKRYHSNAGAQLLAYILEAVYQLPLEKLISRYITAPYKMANTAFTGAKASTKMAIGYTASGKVASYESVMPYFQYAGGLGSTARDMVNYIKLFLDSSNLAAMLSLKKTVDIDASTGKVTNTRPDNTASPEVYSACLNWFKYQPEAATSQLWADGGTNGFNSYLAIYPYLETGVILMANKSSEKIFRSLPGIAYAISKLIAGK
jgi:CubicO group peptidase (beta-lactamase class C family)